MYQIGDKVVHPMYGAGVLESIVQRKIDGVERDYYMMKLPNRSMVVIISHRTQLNYLGPYE